MNHGENDQRHDVLHEQDGHGERVLIDGRGKGLGADLHDDELRITRHSHSVDPLEEQQGRYHDEGRQPDDGDYGQGRTVAQVFGARIRVRDGLPAVDRDDRDGEGRNEDVGPCRVNTT